MPQTSSTMNQDQINEINKLVSTKKERREFPSFSEAVDVLVSEALDARNKSKNTKK